MSDRRLCSTLLAVLAGFAVLSLAEEADPDADETKPGVGKDELDAAERTGTGTLFRLVRADKPSQGFDERLFWRSIPSYAAAETFPVRIQVDGDDVIAPRRVVGEKPFMVGFAYPTKGRKELREGEHAIYPGKIPFELKNGKLVSSHPAIQIAEGEVRIRCAPVRFDALDADGAPRPAAVKLLCDNASLLREEASFNPLVVWLPVGVKYNSSLGTFTVSADGKVAAEPADLAEGVKVTGAGLRLHFKEAGKAVVQPVPRLARPAVSEAARSGKPTVARMKPYLVPHRQRTAFAEMEEATYQVIVPRGWKGGEASVVCVPAAPADAKPMLLGKLALPSVEQGDYDSRLFVLRMSALPPGDHHLWVEGDGKRSEPVALTVVPWYSRSPFFVHTMSGCTECWPTSDEGLKVLHDAGVEMAAATGFQSQLDTRMPRLDPTLALPGPAELSLSRSANDVLLERLLRHQIRLIDLAPLRGPGMYCETLSYHHSYKPSVDRVVRHMQVYTQQTADYPSFYGVNYSWFPALYGYAEAGVPCDAHVGDRNRVLAENVAKAGFVSPSREERTWYQESKFSADPEKRAKALKIMRQAVDHWQASNRLGFGDHNKLYNDAIRQVRPETVFTLFENAGHDAGKPTSSLFADMAASCYESYTDFGDWPMSAAFTTDWARGNFPGQPVWLTTCWGTSSEGKMKSLFHAFGRGLDGGGVPMQAGFGLQELARHGTGMAFCGQYGAIATHAIPDRRFAILATDSEQVFGDRTMYAYHALYCHLTRLGCAPVILAEPEVQNVGIPETAKVLFVVRQQQPLEPETLKAIEGFQKRGGKVAMTGDCLAKLDGAILVEKPIKHIWQLSGFEGKCHKELWDEFDANWRQPLADALGKTGIPPLATTDPDRGIVVSLDAPPLRYVVVIADKKGAHSNVFEPTEALPVSLEGTGWIVRDLVKQATLPTSGKDGRTEVAVDLITEPTTILALFRAAPGTVLLKARESRPPGSGLSFSCDVLGGGTDGPRLGPVPVRYTIHDQAGKLQATLFRAAGDAASFSLPKLDPPGKWKLTAQELITGLTASIELTVHGPADPAPSVVPIGDVHVVNAEHLRAFAKRGGEKLVIVEPSQARLLPVAKRLAEKLKARLWEVKPEEYDTIPVRWYPRPEDVARMKEIEAGRLIGYRRNMEPYINKKTRSHEPERGGYAEIDPPYMVGTDCIVFSGGPLAESLRAVTPWMDTPNVPGRGQGRLVVCFSPFMADRQVVAVVGNDVEGIAKAAEELARLCLPPEAARSADFGRAMRGRFADEALGTEKTPVPQPYRVYTPIRRFQRLLATREGKAVLLLNGKKDTVAFVDEAGKVTGTVAAEIGSVPHARLDAQGRLWDFEYKVTATHPGWHYPTAYDIRLRCIAPDGGLAASIVGFSGETEGLPPDYRGGFPVAPDGSTAAFGRRAGMLFGKLGETAWQRYDDVPHVRLRHELRTPRFPVGATFSPDSRYVFFTMDTRPRFGGMGFPAFTPTSCEAILLEAATGKVVWRLREDKPRRSPYAALSGFAAVAKDGAATALADFDAMVYLVDKAGKVLVSEQAFEPPKDEGRGRNGPVDGVGVWIADDGATAAFGFKSLLLIARGKELKRVPVAGLASGCVSGDGSLVVVGLENGDVRALAPEGSRKWVFSTGGVAPFVAPMAGNRTLVATSNGELLLLDAAGKEVRRTNVAEAADRGKHDPKPSAGFQQLASPWDYRGPGTLAYAKEHLAAKQVAAWKPQGEVKKAFGLGFYPASGAIELVPSEKAKEYFVHLVYRRPQGNKSLKVVTEGKDGREEFVLDLPTPEYREVDIPLRGPNAKATVSADGPVEIADCSLWSFRWPGANVAYVRPPKVSGEATKEEGDDLGGAVSELEGAGATPGAMKECTIWWFNTDPDSVAGAWLRPVVDALEMVDGKRFGRGKVKPWADRKGTFAPYRGGWITIDLKTPTRLRLVATYDRVAKQSEVSVNLSVISGFDATDSTSGKVLTGAVGNDQFWRLFPLPGQEVRVLGVHAYAGDNESSGLSEVEAYSLSLGAKP